ncbi:MAG: stage II sporulation protein M [Saprospiraceae bacterium]
MRETSFIQQNEKKWKAFEQTLDSEQQDPARLNDIFIQVTDDLSHARTFYPNRSVRVYLNGLAQRLFFNIYKNKQSKRSRFTAFWLDDLPILMYEARKELLLSFLVFILAVAIGMLSSAADPGFVQAILGDDYVRMTQENIRSGDPMAVYKERGAFNMFLGITLNNIMVSFYTFAMGLFYAIGTLGILLRNGIMLGAFQYFFIEQGLFRESFLAVWLHGAFELSSIVIAGAAGLTMGRGLVFPGTLTRMRSFQLAARRGISMMMGVLPLFIIAGFTESYLTRHTDAPDLLRGAFIALCLGFVLFYFVLYPRWKAKRTTSRALMQRLPPGTSQDIDYSGVKTTGEFFTDTFIFLRKNFKPVAITSAGGAAIYCAGAFLAAKAPAIQLFSFPGGLFGTFSVLHRFFVNDLHPWLFPLTVIALSATAFSVQLLMDKESSSGPSDQFRLPGLLWSFLKTLAVIILLNLVIITLDWYTPLLMFFTFPLFFLWMQTMLTERAGFVRGAGRTVLLSGGVYFQMLGLFFTLTLCGILFFLLLDTGILWFLLDVFSMNFFFSEENGVLFSTVLSTFISMFVLLMIFSLWVAGFGLQYFSNREVHEATFLKECIKNIRVPQRIRGLERE